MKRIKTYIMAMLIICGIVLVTCYFVTEGKFYFMRLESVGADSIAYYENQLGLLEESAYISDPVPACQIYEIMKIPGTEEDGVARAFPGAEGGGMYTTGGRGGRVIHVTNLNDSGNGSLRSAISASGARTIVFDVAGIITLKSPLIIQNGDVTIAGQTAPGDGICIKGRYTQVDADNVIIRFVRFRLGDEDPNAGDNDDAIWGRYHNNIILDHCSMSWSVDECASFYANTNMTMSWCILAESMRNCSLHSKGNHGYGGIWGGDNASFHHNLLAHHSSRNPRFDHPHVYENHATVPHRGVVDFRNNVVYDWGFNNSYGGEGYGAGKGAGINMIANYYKPGPSSKNRKYFIDALGVYSRCDSCGENIDEGYPLLYINGNIHTKNIDITTDNAKGILWHDGESHANFSKTGAREFSIKGPEGQSCRVTTHTAKTAAAVVCAFGGASLRRDIVDSRIVQQVKNGTGRIIDCVTDTKGKTSVYSLYGYTWPEYKALPKEKAKNVDTDRDGMPDWFEKRFGLDETDASDGNKMTIDCHKRYTNLEMYLHYLVRNIVKAQDAGGI